MSADRWDTCPKCVEDKEKAFLTLSKEVANSYGKIPVEDFDLLRAKLDQERNKSHEETLREDYEFYRDSYILHIDYQAECSKCGWKQRFSQAVYNGSDLC